MDILFLPRFLYYLFVKLIGHSGTEKSYRWRCEQYIQQQGFLKQYTKNIELLHGI